MKQIKQIAEDSRVLRALSSLEEQQADLIDLIIAIQQIPSPTLDERRRANFVENYFSDLGLAQVQQDDIYNVYACLRGTDGIHATPLILTAHSDTVFPIDTDLTTKIEGNYLYGPGIGDNATGVAGIITLAKHLLMQNLKPEANIWFVANVAEEGLGDLRGMRAVVERFGSEARYIVVEGGSFGQIMHQAIGSKRYRITVETPGGHSWGNFGQPSAIHELGQLICEISNLRIPRKPKTTFNVGVIEGGTSINSIASSASLLLDLRSDQKSTLDQLVSQVNTIVAFRRNLTKQRQEKVTIHMELVGSRPVGNIPKIDPLVRLAEDALKQVGWRKISNIAGSTDANVPLSMKIPTVCIGITTSKNAHRIDEYIELTHLTAGMKQLLLLTLAAADY
ncbi:MAG: M20/M25/M40 family metallo-hydrolase [Candidatus Promineifilaceae bacterium]|nr:M20/M25/M40 family metallo-hydrolase [Candidatus Promineifilaceae bacterium]